MHNSHRIESVCHQEKKEESISIKEGECRKKEGGGASIGGL